MKLAPLSLCVMAATFLGLGLMSLTAPKILTQLVEISMPTPIAVMEVRGVYGGLFFGIGAFFFCSPGVTHGFGLALSLRPASWVGLSSAAPSAFYSTARQAHSSPRSLPEKFSWS